MSVGPYTKYGKTTLRVLGMSYAKQKFGAARRRIDFLLTFGEWLQIWVDSGHLLERGCRKGQYVMARFGDKGPYAVGNVKIVTCNVNNKEAAVGNKRALGVSRSKKTRVLISQKLCGRSFSLEHCSKLSEKAHLRKMKRDGLGRYTGL